MHRVALRWPLVLVLVLVLAAACGSRTGLRELGQGGADGAGGASSAVSVGATGTGGAGGSSSTGTASGSGAGSTASTGQGGSSPGVCVLTPISPVATVGETAGHTTLGTRLSYSSDARDRVSVVYGKDPTPTVALVRHAYFFPWDDWPAGGTIGGGLDALLSTDGLHLVAPFPGDRLGLLGRELNVNFVGGSPTGNLYSLATVYGGVGAGRPLTIAPGAADALVAFEFPIDLEIVGLATGRVTMDVASQFHGPNVLGCGSPRVSAAGLWQAGAWLLVSATSQPLGPCDLDRVGPAHVLTISRLTPSGTLLQNLDTWDEPAAVREVLAAVRSDGAWVAWLRDGSTSDVWAARLDASGSFAAGPYAVTAGAAPAADGLFAISTLGDDLLVAWGMESGAIGVRLVGDEGEALSHVVLPTSGTLFDAVSVLGAPSGDAAVVGYTEGGLNGKPAGRLVKLDCGLGR